MKRVRDRVQLVRNETKAEAPEMAAAQSLAPPELSITSGMEDQDGMHAAAAKAAPAPATTPAKPARKRIEGMPEALQEHLEATFGQDFSDIKVHTNSSQASKAGALAFARGREVHFAPGQFQPDTPQGRQLIGHEFAHLVQQGAQQVKANTAAGGMPVNDDPALEAAADAMGARFAKMEPAQEGGSALSPLAAEAGVMQMKAESALATAPESPVEEAPAADTPAHDNTTQEGGPEAEPDTEQAAKEDGAPDPTQDEKEDQAPEEEHEGPNPEMDTLLEEQEGQMEEMASGAEQEGEESAEAAEGEAAQLAPDPNGGGKGLLDWGNLTYILAPTITLPGLAIEKLSKAASAGLEKTSAPDWLKNGVKTVGNVQGSINAAIHQYGGELFEGAVMGDFKEDPTAMNLVGQVLIGLVPYAGQAADLRDTVHAIGKMTNGGWKEGGNWLNLGLTLLAWVPLLGDGVKVLSKLGKLKGVKNFLKKLEPVSKAVSEGWGKVTKYFAPKIDAFKKTLSKGWNDLKNTVTSKFNAAKAKVMSTVNKAKSGLSSAWNWVKGKASAGMDWIKGKAAAGWDKAKSLIAKGTKKLSDGIAKAAKVVQQKAAALPQKLLNKTKAIWEGVKSGAKSIKDKVKSSLNGIKNKFERFVGRVRQKWNDWRGKGQSPPKSQLDFSKLGINDAIDHVSARDLSVPRKKGIGGCHNKAEWEKISQMDISKNPSYLPPKGKKPEEIEEVFILRRTDHATVPGVEKIDYQIPSLDKGVTSGLLRPSDPFKKTLFDPAIWPESKLRVALQEALQNAADKNGGVIPATFSGLTKEGYVIGGYFRDGKVSTFFFE